MSAPTEKILIVGPSWVGDMVMSQPLYQYLQHSRPEVSIDVLAPAWSGPLLARMPEVRRHISMPLSHGEIGLRKRWQLGRELAGQGYTQAIVLPNSLKSALVPVFAGITSRTGWRGEMRYGLLNDLRVLNEDALPLMVQRFVALAIPAQEPLPENLPQPALVSDRTQAQKTAVLFGLDDETPLLALCPGAEFGEAKRWPASYYAQIARDYLARGWRVLLFGSSNDASVCQQIFSGTQSHARCSNLAGTTSLEQAVDLLSLCTAVLSNDSGLMHVAGALGVPLVAIYGATSPEFTPPAGDKVAIIRSDLDCAPCFARTCPLQHHRCMRDTTPEFVHKVLDSFSAGTGAQQ